MFKKKIFIVYAGLYSHTIWVSCHKRETENITGYKLKKKIKYMK